MAYEPLPNDWQPEGDVSDCCGAPVWLTNGHERKDAPGIMSTWWNVCDQCGHACDARLKKNLPSRGSK